MIMIAYNKVMKPTSNCNIPIIITLTIITSKKNPKKLHAESVIARTDLRPALYSRSFRKLPPQRKRNKTIANSAESIYSGV